MFYFKIHTWLDSENKAYSHPESLFKNIVSTYQKYIATTSISVSPSFLLTLWYVLPSLTTAHGTRPPTIHKLDLYHGIFLWKWSARHWDIIFPHLIINILHNRACYLVTRVQSYSIFCEFECRNTFAKLLQNYLNSYNPFLRLCKSYIL